VGFKNYAVKIRLDAMIYTSSFVKSGSGIQKLLWWIERQLDDNPTVIIFKMMKVGQNIINTARYGGKLL
jgi:hypothetical protein